jgi:hypothetical protein
MKKSLTILFFVLAFSFSNVPSRVFAQDASSTPTTINARILPTLWYSSLSVNDGDSIKIYAGIQINSGVNFTGMATFYVDDKEISTGPFSSSTDSLKDISSDWVANPGDHSVQVKVSTSLPSSKVLVSDQSDKSNISITQKIVPITSAVVEAAVLNAASNIVSQTDNLASTLANNIDSLKKSVVTNNPSVTTNDSKGSLNKTLPKKVKGSVLGASAGPAESSDAANNNPMDFIYNFFLSMFSFLVRNWKWTLGGVVTLFILLKIIR